MQARETMISGGAIQVALTLIQGGSQQEQVASLGILATLVERSDSAKEQVGGAKSVASLMHAAKSSTSEGTSQALWALRQLIESQRDDGVADVVAKNVEIEPLASLAGGEGVGAKARRDAAIVLKNAAQSRQEEAAKSCRANLEGLAHLATGSDQEGASAAMALLYLGVEGEEAKDDAVKLGLAKVCTSTLSGTSAGYPIAKAYAAGCLWRLCVSQEGELTLGDHPEDWTDPYWRIKMLKEKQLGRQSGRESGRSDRRAEHLLGAGAVESLTAFLDECTSQAPVKGKAKADKANKGSAGKKSTPSLEAGATNAAGALRNLAGLAEGRRRMAEAGIQPLVRCLSSSRTLARHNASTALELLSIERDYRDLLNQAGAPSWLTSIPAHEENPGEDAPVAASAS